MGRTARIEALIERIGDETTALAHLRASKSPRPGTMLEFAGGCTATVVGRHGNLFELAFSLPVAEVMERFGEVPLPPYLQRDAEPGDDERYQTVYARRPGAVAAPTAGLHFDEDLLADLERRGIGHCFVTLHVGAGTFQTLKHEAVDDNRLHFERIEVTSAAAERIGAARAEGGRIVAVGTTDEIARAYEAAGRQEEANERKGMKAAFFSRVCQVCLPPCSSSAASRSPGCAATSTAFGSPRRRRSPSGRIWRIVWRKRTTPKRSRTRRGAGSVSLRAGLGLVLTLLALDRAFGIDQGFEVFPYTTDDLVLCTRLYDAGCRVIMPWASPIGSGQGIINPYALRTLRARLPVDLAARRLQRFFESATALMQVLENYRAQLPAHDPDHPLLRAVGAREVDIVRQFLTDHADQLSGKALVACCKGIDTETLTGPATAIRRTVPEATPAARASSRFTVAPA